MIYVLTISIYHRTPLTFPTIPQRTPFLPPQVFCKALFCVCRVYFSSEKTCVLFPTVIFVCIFILTKLELFSLSSSFSGFDFDLDEVWAPLNPHLRSLKSTSSTPRYTYLNFRAKNILVAVVYGYCDASTATVVFLKKFFIINLFVCSPGSSASSSSENSISGLPRVPMQSASVFGSGGSSGDADTSRVPTARLSQRGRKSQHEVSFTK